MLLALLFVALLQPIDEIDLQSAGFYRQSLQNVDAAFEDAVPPAGELQAGAARVEIAPPLEWRVGLGGTRMLSVCPAREKREESVHARSLAVSDGRRVVILLAADVLVFSPELRRRTLELVQRDIPIESRDFLAVATHTHSGPGSFWEGGLPESVLGSYQERSLEFLSHRFAESAVQAVANLRPAKLLTDSVDLDKPVFNRGDRFGPEATELRLVRFEGLLEPFSIDVLNYSAHPTSLLPENHRALSGDYPGILAMRLENERRTVMFTPGMIGDQKPAEIVGSAGPQPEAMAYHLETEGMDAMEPVELDTPVLESWELEVLMPPVQLRVSGLGPLASYRLRDAAAERVLEEDLGSTTIQVVRFGSILLFGLPCDLGVSIGSEVMDQARRAGFTPVMISMSNEWIGYVFTEEEYRRAEYKATSQLHGPSSGPLFRDVLMRIVARLAEREISATEEAGSQVVRGDVARGLPVDGVERAGSKLTVERDGQRLAEALR